MHLAPVRRGRIEMALGRVVTVSQGFSPCGALRPAVPAAAGASRDCFVGRRGAEGRPMP